MKLLAPLGLLGLISIIILIIIYIIRPNFQQKMVSSTFIWKLSLKYKKKRIPTSKLRNILLILCQVLILATCAAILAKPVTVTKTPTDNKEVVAVIESSASMRAAVGTGANKESRFKRAVAQAMDLADDVFDNGGTMSIIIANEKPYFFVPRTGFESREFLESELENLLADDSFCSYGTSDVKSAMMLCETIVDKNVEAQVYLYTDTQYDVSDKLKEKIHIQSVRAEEGEWNMSILNAWTEFDDNQHSLSVDLATYGINMEVKLSVAVHNANPDLYTGVGQTIILDTSYPGKTGPIACQDSKTTKVIFLKKELYQPGIGSEEGKNVFYYLLDQDEEIHSYADIAISISPYDSAMKSQDAMPLDDTFNIYGGQKEPLKIQYASSLPNPFFSSILVSMKNYLLDWDIQITEIKKGAEFATQGFDIYIFEHMMPTSLPTDGIVLLADPETVPSGAGFLLESIRDFNKVDQYFSETEGKTDHPLMKELEGENITVTRYTRVRFTDPAYETLMTCDGGYPVLAVKNELDSKVVVLPFNIHYSNFAGTKEFPLFMVNLLRYFLPATVTENVFEVNKTVEFQSRGEKLWLKTNAGETLEEYDTPLAYYTFNKPGSYALDQSDFLGKKVPTETIFIRMPKGESNIVEISNELYNPYKEEVKLVHYKDWLFYMAAALVFLLFAEWWLQCRDHM